MPKQSLEGSIFPGLEQDMRSISHVDRNKAVATNGKVGEKRDNPEKTEDNAK